MTSVIKLKGMSDSIVRCIIPEDLPSSELSAAFGDLKQKGGGILAGAGIVLDFGARSIDGPTVGDLLSEFIWPSGASVTAWITYDAPSQELLKRAGFKTTEPSRAEGGPCGSLVLHRSLRSGQRVEHRGDVIIAGHVNDGAEVIASGSITVLGRLSGLVHAGYEGDESTVAAARWMEALQVRIGSRVGSLTRDAEWWGRHVIASVNDGAVLIDFWPAAKTGNTSNNARIKDDAV